MNSLPYLIKTKIENEEDKVTLKYLKLSLAQDNKLCKKCGIVQGKEYLGVKKYYCEHVTEQIRRKLKKENKEIMQKAIMLTLESRA